MELGRVGESFDQELGWLGESLEKELNSSIEDERTSSPLDLEELGRCESEEQLLTIGDDPLKTFGEKETSNLGVEMKHQEEQSFSSLIDTRTYNHNISRFGNLDKLVARYTYFKQIL